VRFILSFKPIYLHPPPPPRWGMVIWEKIQKKGRENWENVKEKGKKNEK
jgi:hypothetical protein